MDKLVSGIQSFQTDVFPEKENDFKSLEGGQSPRVLFVTCSDSSVCPHLFTSSEPGELFVIRNAGNLTPAFRDSGSGEEATIEYAVAGLKVERIVVCGHSNCGAMKALKDPESAATLPSVQSWMRRAQSTLSSAGENASLDALIETNVLRQLDNLRTHPSVAARLAAGDLTLHGWVYEIGTGKVRAYDEATSRFENITESLKPLSRGLALAG